MRKRQAEKLGKLLLARGFDEILEHGRYTPGGVSARRILGSHKHRTWLAMIRTTSRLLRRERFVRLN